MNSLNSFSLEFEWLGKLNVNTLPELSLFSTEILLSMERLVSESYRELEEVILCGKENHGVS